MELESVDALRNAYADARVLARRKIGIAREQLVAGSTESHKAGRIRAIAKINPNGAHRSAVTDSNSYGLNHIVEFLVGALPETEADLIDTRINITHVVKQHASYIFADQREAQFSGMK